MTTNLPSIPLSKKQCPRCFDKPRLTTWKAPAGIDPDMREYKCPRCGARDYVVVQGSSKINLEVYLEQAWWH